jgi:ubiquinone/menaquinone biosynthesis C-methylase UbiE
MASFGPVAPYYDELMSEVPYDMWAGYYRLLLEQIGAKPRSLLDVCCGTGNVAELLAAEGFEVTGFDLSKPMIAQAKKKAREKGLPIAYTAADAAKLDLGRTFDAAYSFFDSLNYITDPQKLHGAIGRVAAHLPKGGSFVFDVNTAYAFENKMFDQQDTRRATRLKYKWRGAYDSATRLIKVTMKFWHEGGEFEETHVQRAYSDEELREFLGDAEMRVEHVYESYTLDRPRATSDRLHYVAIKQRG